MRTAMAADNGTRAGRPVLRSPAAAQQLVLDVLREHAESLLRVARRHSLCQDDAHDAYQRAVEIFLRHAATLDADNAYKWLHTVLKHEAMRLRASRTRMVDSEDVDLDGHVSRSLPTADEQLASFDLLTRSAEALQRLKPQELRALWLRAQGHSYNEIAEITQWSFTKVNRCITEGRRSFLDRYTEIGSGEECRRWEPVLSALVDGEATAKQLAGVRPHLRNCPACRAHVRALRESSLGLAALLPVPAVFAASPRDAGLLTRVYEAVAGSVQERVVVAATKLQTGIEGVLPSKLAVAAASAAAVAGGGVAVERAVTATSRHDAMPAIRAAPASAAVTASSLAPAEPVPPRPATTRQPAGRPATRHPARRTTKREFAIGRQRARSASVAETTAEREFAPASAPATSASFESAAAPPPPAPPAPAPAPAPSRDAKTAAAEFGG